jgi:hypothetical protein
MPAEMPTDPVAEIAQTVNFFRRITTIVLLGVVLAGGAFGVREYIHHEDAQRAAAECNYSPDYAAYHGLPVC